MSKEKQVIAASSAQAPSSRGEARDDILQAALGCFAENGFDGTSIADIARAAGVGHPLVHYHFKSKDQLWREAVVYAFKDLAFAFQTISFAADDLEPLDALKVISKAFIRFCSQYPQHVALLFAEGTADTERFKWAIETWLRPFHAKVDSLIVEAARKGQIKAVPPVHLVNLIVGAGVQFASARSVIQRLYNVDPLDPKTAAEHADWTIEIILNGLRPQG